MLGIKQESLFQKINPLPSEGKLDASEINLLTWNISNPSRERAYRQLEWLRKSDCDVMLLTEAKHSDGCNAIKDELCYAGFQSFLLEDPRPEESHDDYSVIVAVRGYEHKLWPSGVSFLPGRLVSLTMETSIGELKVVGMYVPSRGPKEMRNVNKMRFQNQVMDWLSKLKATGNANNLVIAGDLNVVEPDHVPHYSVFGDWEYEFYKSFEKCGLVDCYRFLHPATTEHSWFGKYGDGYRFDHFFVSENLCHSVKRCDYLHEPRLNKLSDHSAMALSLQSL